MPHALDRVGPAAIRAWLTEADPVALNALWARADDIRRTHVGQEIHLRGLIEVSNYCVRQCAYCGIAACAGPLPRYRLTEEQILACAHHGRRLGFGTIVLQGGEDPGVTREFVARVVRRIKDETGAAITLSLGERDDEDLIAWREAGADRYLLRFETTDPDLYARIHPSLPGTASDRIAHLIRLRAMGYEIGTGIMVGLPGQTWDTLVSDIWAFRDFDMDMIGIGPYLPSPHTPLAGPLKDELTVDSEHQVPNDELTTLKVVALTRLVCPDTNIPSTTALSILEPAGGRAHGLERGANVVMPNLTPPEYRVLYEIYPGKAAVHETADDLAAGVFALIERLGRTAGTGPGGRRKASDEHGTHE